MLLLAPVMGSLFSSLHGCNITISPQNFSVNIGCTSNTQAANVQAPEIDFDDLFRGIDMEIFM